MKKVVNSICENYIIFCIYAFIGWIYEVSWFLIMRNKFVNRGVLFGPFLPIYGFGVLILLFLLKRFMSKKHNTDNILYTSLSIFTIVTFIYTTIIEYTTPKIYNVMTYLNKYGIYLLIINIVSIVLINIIVKKFNIKIDTSIILTFLLIWVITTLVEFIGHYIIETYFDKLLWDYSKDFLNIDRRVNWDASRNFAIGGTVLLYTIQPLINKIFNKIKINTKVVISLLFGIPMLIDFIINVVIK